MAEKEQFTRGGHLVAGSGKFNDNSNRMRTTWRMSGSQPR